MSGIENPLNFACDSLEEKSVFFTMRAFAMAASAFRNKIELEKIS
ncbi:hypothetical protein ACLBWS_07710 [Brucellaceae bacterium D45D]